jgi:hypothetical protein
VIRAARHDDIPALLEMGEKFSSRAGLVHHVGYNPEHMAATFAAMIDAEDHVILIGERGAIGAVCCPHPFNYDHKAAQELFWWSEGREGLALLTALETWARGRAASLQMITLEAVEPERTSKIYARKGFVPLERSFIKVW